MNLKLYTYDNCGTCRKAMQHLRSLGVDAKPIPIREQTPSLAELKRMLKIYHRNIRKLFNTSGRDYKELKLGEKLDAMSECDALALLASNGNLVKRPFLLARENGAVGFDPSVWDEILKTK